MRRSSALALLVVALAIGCGDDGSSVADLSSAALDLGASGDLALPPLSLTSGGATRLLATYYSYWIEPRGETGGTGTDAYLILTAIDPRFRCDASAPANVDAISIQFHARLAGASSSTVVARHGPTLGSTIGASGWAMIDRLDDRLLGYDLDGGTIDVDAAGSVVGRMQWQIDGLSLSGSFRASYCAALDLIVPG